LTNTQLIEIGIGAVALIFSIVALVFIFRTRVKVSRMQATSTSTVKEAAQLASPEGTTVELYATAQTDQPLRSPVTGTSSIFFRHKVEELSVRDYQDSNGYYRQSQDWSTVSDTQQHAPFWLGDSTGSIQVNPRDAEFVAEETATRLPGGVMTSPGGTGFMGDVMNIASFMSNKTGELRQSEWVIRTGLPTYVIGEAVQTAAGPAIKSGETGLIISYKSEEELTKRYQWHFAGWIAGCSIGGIGGLILVMYVLSAYKNPSHTTYMIAAVAGFALIFIGAFIYLISRRSEPVPRAKPLPIRHRPSPQATLAGAGLTGGAVGGAAAFAQGSPADAQTVAPQPVAVTGPRVGVIQHDVVISGQVAFHTGEMVQVEGESPDAQRPEYRYVVQSQALGKKFRLSSGDVQV